MSAFTVIENHLTQAQRGTDDIKSAVISIRCPLRRMLAMGNQVQKRRFSTSAAWSEIPPARSMSEYSHDTSRWRSCSDRNAWSIRKPFPSAPRRRLYHENALWCGWSNRHASTNPSSAMAAKCSEQLKLLPSGSASPIRSPVFQSPTNRNGEPRRVAASFSTARQYASFGFTSFPGWEHIRRPRPGRSLEPPLLPIYPVAPSRAGGTR